MGETLEDKVHKLYTDMYVGDGKDNPSMTTRMAMTEDAVVKISDGISKLVWVSVGTFLTAASSIILRFVFKI